MQPLIEAVILLVVILLACAAGCWWTWWLSRDRHQPLKDAAVTTAEFSVAVTQVLARLGDELARSHETNARVLLALTQAAVDRNGRGVAVAADLLASGQTAVQDDELAVLREEVARSRARRDAQTAHERSGYPVDPSGEGFDDEDA